MKYIWLLCLLFLCSCRPPITEPTIIISGQIKNMIYSHTDMNQNYYISIITNKGIVEIENYNLFSQLEIGDSIKFKGKYWHNTYWLDSIVAIWRPKFRF